MYTTLIVDDEQLMRKYLENQLSIICPDFCVTGIACDGLEAVELLERQSFDLVITDIKMPEMDGLSLANYIYDLSLPTKVIILSGYNEFEYARTALKYGVCDYLLKPISDINIAETLSKIKNQLEMEASRQSWSASNPTYKSNEDIKSALLSAILKNNFDLIQPLFNLMQSKNIPFIKPYSAIMLLTIDELSLLLNDIADLNTTYRYDLNQLCQSFCKLNNYTSIYDEHGYSLILLSSESEQDIISLAQSIYYEIKNNYWKNNKIKLFSTYGYIVNDIMSLPASFNSAVEALALTLKDIQSPISSHYLSQECFIQEVQTICQTLYSDYISKNMNKASSDINLYVMLFEDNISIASIFRYGIYMIKYIAKKCNIKNDHTINAFHELVNGINSYLSIDNLDKQKAHALLFQAFKALDHDKIMNTLPEATRIVENAKEYICTHYQEQISLMIVADKLNINTSYLSNLFHKIIGEPYSKYLTKVRMEQAVLLLKSNPNEKIYNIAEKTGFVSAKHFNTVFKKFYGITPTEYLKGMLT